MNEPYRIESKGKLPEPEQLLLLLQSHNTLRVDYPTPDVGYYNKLLLALDDYIVFDMYWESAYYIEPGLDSKEIFKRKQEVYACAKSFRQDAIKLMNLMAETFDINLQNLDGLYEVKHKKGKNQRGKLNEAWVYHLHGAECRFENSVTGQVVEVIVVTHPEFGYLDSYFFFEYMQTTERFQLLAHWFGNHKNVYKALELLAIDGILTKNSSVGINRNIVAL
jgi:hypothetical protein